MSAILYTTASIFPGIILINLAIYEGTLQNSDRQPLITPPTCIASCWLVSPNSLLIYFVLVQHLKNIIKWQKPRYLPGLLFLLYTLYIFYYAHGDWDSTICISVCSHIYRTNLFAAIGKYNPSVIREKSAVFMNQAKISRPLALYTILTVLSCLVICYPLTFTRSSGIEVQAKCVLYPCML